MSYAMKPSRLLIVLLLFTLGCSDEPANKPGAKKLYVEEVAPTVEDVKPASLKSYDIYSPEAFSSPGENEELGVKLNELKLANLRKPVVYGVGAAGITMDTTFDESKKLLTPPFRGPFEDGVTFYDEQVVVIWKDEGDRKPALIIPLKGYLGKLAAGKFGELDFQTKFLDYKGANPAEGAAQLTRELYNELENVEDKNYDCLVTSRCRLLYGTADQPNMVLIFPGAILLLAKEEFQIAEMRIRRFIDPGMLSNNLDLLSGDILIPNDEPLKLGQFYHEIFERLDAYNQDNFISTQPEVYVRTDFIGYSWDGFWYSFHRNNYSIEVEGSEITDQSKTVSISSGYSAYVTVEGKRILMKQSSDDVSFALESLPDPATHDQDTVIISDSEIESKLKMNTLILKGNSLKFARKFAKFLKGQLVKKYDSIHYTVLGYQNKNVENKDITLVLKAVNSETLKGISILVQVSEEQRRLGFIQVSLLDPKFNGFDFLIQPATSNNVERIQNPEPMKNDLTGQLFLDLTLIGAEKAKLPYYTELSGMKLNDLLFLTDIDALGRQEATVEFVSRLNRSFNKKGEEVLSDMKIESGNIQIKERAGYIEQGNFEVPKDSHRRVRNQGFVGVGSDGLSLGIQVIGANAKGRFARVVSISSNNIYGDINDLCGLGDTLALKKGMTDVAVERALLKAIGQKKAEDSRFECNYFPAFDKGEKGRLLQYYFPDQRIKLEFGDRALSAVTIYLPLNQVYRALPEGN